ncbi:MAG: asparagine synthetase B, partial [Alphaproteobacteria bacterium]|nr:asparagine synthetase B [Alphaproteobacteria bacterium]
MCGLIGLIDPMLDDNVMPTLLDSIYHRGPDGEGRHQHGKLRMGMRRLAVIDIAGGGQPQFAWSDRIVAFQNGEIYNYRELRDELKERELICRTKTDTEVIALGYTAWGIEGLLQRLDGMFALAILDKNRHELHLARDRFGEKPLFYASVGGCFAYGSDLVTLASLPWVNREIDRLGLARYLALHFIPGDRTILTGIN